MSYPYISPEFRSYYQEYLENPSEMKIVFLVLSMSFLTVNPVSNKLFEYSSSSVEDAKRVAQKTDQPLLIYYTADWCLPCQIMNEYTFSDEYLTSEIHKNFVTVQVDKDDAESVEMIEEYNICCLPTFQIINPEGEVTKYSEGYISISEFYQFLDIPNPSSLANQSQEVITNVEKIGIEDNESKDTDFQSGRIEVNENTYAELKSKSVNTIGNSGLLTEEQVNSRLAEVENTDSNIEESGIKLPSKSNEGQKQKDLTSGKVEAKIDGSNEVQSTEVTVDDDIKETLANDPTETELKMMRATKGEDSSVNTSKELPDVAPSKAVNTESNIVSNISKEENEAPLLDNTPSDTDSEGNSSVVALSHDVDINTDIYTDQNNRESSGRLEYIQAGAFRNILNAHKLRNSLYSEMEKVLLVEESEENLCDGKKLYKVLLGPVTDSKERKIFTQVLEEQGIKSFSVLK